MQLRPGMIVGGKYRLERALGHGGMGRLWVARHAQLGSSLAVKFLAPKFAASPVYRQRFEREARAAAILKCPQVVHVQDYGFEGDTPFIVMELLEGEDLGSRLSRVGRLGLKETETILAQTSKALRRAHEAGIVHRDVKPANLFLARVGDDEVVKVLDFGIAKDLSAAPGDTTSTGELLGSPHYMSPEQIAAARDIDARADLWSVGVILFRALTGKLPFPGTQVTMVITAILQEPLPIPTELRPDLPPAMDAFFARALARDRAHRFASIDELESAFREAMGPSAAPQRISAVPVPPEPAVRAAEPPQPGGARDAAPADSPARRRNAVLAIIAAVFLLGVATGVLLFRRSPAAEPSPSAAATSVSTAVPPAPPALDPAPVSAAPAAAPSPEPEPTFEVLPPDPQPSVESPPPDVPSASPKPPRGHPVNAATSAKPAASAIPMRDKWF